MKKNKNNLLELDNKIYASIILKVKKNQKFLIDLTKKLVEIPSLLGDEKYAQEFVENEFKKLNLKIHKFPVLEKEIKKHPGYSPSVGNFSKHENIVGTHLPETTYGRSLILNGHIDVVPIGDLSLWSNNPFKAIEKNGRIYGRGSGDMKAGIAAYITAFKSILDLGLLPAAKVHLQSVVEEECTGNGALSCLIKGYKANAAIIPEPFNETIMSSQVGVMWIQIEIFGKPAHVLNSEEGMSAIEGAFKIWKDLKKLEKKWNLQKKYNKPFNKLRNPIKFNLGIIKGGEWASSVPTKCTMEIRVGFYPDQKITDVKKSIEGSISTSIKKNKSLKNIFYKLNYSGFQSRGCIVDTNSKFIRTLEKAHIKVNKKKPELFASAATTDAKLFNLYGDTPATCYGPEAKNIHGIDESVSIESTQRVATTIALFIADWCKLIRKV